MELFARFVRELFAQHSLEDFPAWVGRDFVDELDSVHEERAVPLGNSQITQGVGDSIASGAEWVVCEAPADPKQTDHCVVDRFGVRVPGPGLGASMCLKCRWWATPEQPREGGLGREVRASCGHSSRRRRPNPKPHGRPPPGYHAELVASGRRGRSHGLRPRGRVV